jgi:hypothetical protein
MDATYSGSRPGLSRSGRGQRQRRLALHLPIDFIWFFPVGFVLAKICDSRLLRARRLGLIWLGLLRLGLLWLGLLWLGLLRQPVERPDRELAARARAALVAGKARGPPDGLAGRRAVAAREGFHDERRPGLAHTSDLRLRKSDVGGHLLALGARLPARDRVDQRLDQAHRLRVAPHREREAMAAAVTRRARFAGRRPRPGAAPRIAAVGVDASQAGHAVTSASSYFHYWIINPYKKLVQ